MEVVVINTGRSMQETLLQPELSFSPRCSDVPLGGRSLRSCTSSLTIFSFQKGTKGLLNVRVSPSSLNT